MSQGVAGLVLPRPSGRAAAVGRFVQHFVEMVLAMQVGMLLFGLFVGGILGPLGLAGAFNCGTDIHRVGMAVFMTVPMVAWMRVRGHGWRHGIEMSAGMLAPTATGFVLQGLGMESVAPWLTQGCGCGPLMYLGMLAVMLYRRDHYLGTNCH